MIRKSLEIGTKVFNGVYGFGIFKGWNDYGDAIIDFNGYIGSLLRKNLTEVEDEPEDNKPKNKEKHFDPPI